MPKRVAYTQITPLPNNIPRQLALDMLHSHGEIIELNPLVTSHRPIPVPRDAPADEFFAQWHEIDETITWGLGMKKKITFRVVYHDMPWGLQTHAYAPMGIDLRNKWQVRGNQPGEPREAKELGSNAPTDGLYLREDVEIVANLTLTGFVKKEMKAAAAVMVQRLKRKAELLDDGVLEAMFEGGRLKTINPAQEAHLANAQQALSGAGRATRTDAGLLSPALTSPPASPRSFDKSVETVHAPFRGNYHDVARANSLRGIYTPAYQQNGYRGPDVRRVSHVSSSGISQYSDHNPMPEGIVEAPGSYYHPQSIDQSQASKFQGASFTAELPGNEQYLTPRDAHRGSGSREKQQSPLQQAVTPDSAQHQPFQPPIQGSYPSPSNSQYSQPESPGALQPQQEDRQERLSNPGLGISQQEAPRQPNGSYVPYNPHDYNNVAIDARHNAGLASNQNVYQNTQQRTSPNPDTNDPFNTANLRENLPPASMSRSSVTQQYPEPVGQGYAGVEDAVPSALRPRHQNFSRMTNRGEDSTDVGVVRCPVCKNFSGDEAAVSHHVSTHFS